MQLEITQLSKISDKRGWLIEIINDKTDQRTKNIHYSYSKPGAIRGNHYHEHKTEWLCVTYGTGRIVLEDNGTKERKELEVSGNSPVLVKIPPKITHAIENCDASLSMHLMVIMNEEYNSTDPDTYLKQLIFPKAQQGNNSE